MPPRKRKSEQRLEQTSESILDINPTNNEVRHLPKGTPDDFDPDEHFMTEEERKDIQLTPKQIKALSEFGVKTTNDFLSLPPEKLVVAIDHLDNLEMAADPNSKKTPQYQLILTFPDQTEIFLNVGDWSPSKQAPGRVLLATQLPSGRLAGQNAAENEALTAKFEQLKDAMVEAGGRPLGEKETRHQLLKHSATGDHKLNKARVDLLGAHQTDKGSNGARGYVTGIGALRRLEKRISPEALAKNFAIELPAALAANDVPSAQKSLEGLMEIAKKTFGEGVAMEVAIRPVYVREGQGR